MRGVTQALAYAVGPELPDRERETLRHSLATTISSSHQAPSITAEGTAGVPWLSGRAGIELAGDLVTVTRQPGWEGGGPVATLEMLDRLADAHGLALSVVFDDSDVWSVADPSMADRARAFFQALRVLQDAPDVRIIVAVQSHWASSEIDASSELAAARREYRELAERAGSVLTVPLPQNDLQARALMTAIVERRVAIALSGEPTPAGGWASALFTGGALDLLAARCLQHSIRRALSDIRDAFDHLETFPERIGDEHLLKVIVE